MNPTLLGSLVFLATALGSFGQGARPETALQRGLVAALLAGALTLLLRQAAARLCVEPAPLPSPSTPERPA
ncbi:MAG TPA: hypothetical protein DEA08_23565 [Planctomycetes bacterium]|nr:hypothetical protein [Planctomycetota bacterium]|tara:strand:- start:63 stop:275 length:213 start_codon:yes stop_codon:yes gene_type:complete